MRGNQIDKTQYMKISCFMFARAAPTFPPSCLCKSVENMFVVRTVVPSHARVSPAPAKSLNYLITDSSSKLCSTSHSAYLIASYCNDITYKDNNND